MRPDPPFQRPPLPEMLEAQTTVLVPTSTEATTPEGMALNRLEKSVFTPAA
jgi:hypothetical protein